MGVVLYLAPTSEFGQRRILRSIEDGSQTITWEGETVRRALYALGSGVLALTLSMGSMTAAHADDGTTATEVQNAIATVPGLADTSNEVTTQSDADSATIATVNGMTVDVPKDADNSVKVTSGGQQITFDMPDASQAQTGTVTANGIVAYPTNGDHANAVQTDDNGGVRFIQVLNGPDAPEEFHYDLHLPANSSIARLADGSLLVHTPTQDYAIETPWAYDATGKKVWTQFFTDGESGIDLVVNHYGEDLTYPITADPRFYSRTWYGGYIIHYTRTETYKLSRGVTLAGIIASRWWYVGAAFGLAGWWAQGVYDRGQCLVAHVWPGNWWATWWWSESC